MLFLLLFSLKYDFKNCPAITKQEVNWLIGSNAKCNDGVTELGTRVRTFELLFLTFMYYVYLRSY